ncbi:MAG: PAS domain S-box protein [Kouleothrix sp.]|nr:PAS domain S-box protein [Kouleothrix sp.]
MIDNDRSVPDRGRAAIRPAWAPGRPLAYALAVALTAVTLLAHLALGITSDEPLLELFLAPIILSAYLGGLGPGLLATALAALLANYLMLPPIASFSILSAPDKVEWASLIVIGALVSVLNEALHRARRRAETSQRRHAITLASIGDGVITTDAQGRITFLNHEAERLTGWSSAEAVGQPLPAVFRIVNEHTGAPVEDPMAKALRDGGAVGPANHTVLIGRAGRATPIDDSGAPIRQADGAIEGVVLVFRDVSAQKQGEAALRERERKLSTIFELLPVGISILDADRNASYVNPALKKILALSEVDLHKHAYGMRTYLDASGSVMPADGFASVRALSENQAIHNVETGIVKEDGGVIWTNVSAVPVEFPDWKVVVVTSDITDRKRAEQALYRSERMLKLFVEHAPAAIAMFDRDMTYIAASRRYLADYRLTRQDILGCSHYEIFPEIPEQWKDIHRRCLAGAIEKSDADPFPRADGTLDWVHWEIHPWYESSAEIGGLVLFSEVITARKRAEQTLQRSAERLRVLADASHAFAEVGAEYQVLLDRVARTTTAVLGEGCSIRLLSEDALWLQLVTLYDVDPAKLELQRIVLGDAPLHVDEPSLTTRVFQSIQPLFSPIVDLEQIRATTSREFWSLVERLGIHSMIGVPMRVQGQAIGVIIVYRHRREQPVFSEDDLTLAQDLADRAALAIGNARLLAQVQHELAERAKAESEVRALSAELEQRVADRTLALTAANKELEAFSYSVSHDLRAPLRAIDGFSRILLEDYGAALPDEAQRYFRMLRSNAQQMGRLIDDLLAFSRLSRQPLRKRSVDAVALVRQCLDELHAEQAGRPVEISVGDLPACAADPALLKQVWINLLSNALKYTRRRDPAAIAIAGQIEGGETIYSVKDNGVGFDMLYSDKLFGVFQRLHRAEEYEGTGVGLAIVQRIIHRHGGRVWAEAAVEQGATFFFTLGGDLP